MTWNELAEMIAKRDSISFEEAMRAIKDTATMIEDAFMDGNLNACDDILREQLGLEPDYMLSFIN